MISWTLIMVSATAYLPPSVELIGTFDKTRIPEASGIVKSQRYPGIFWVHNDSGNLPVLFAVRQDAQIVNAFRIAAPNIDWEDLAVDNDGHLYLGDIGNNTGLLKTRAVYRIDEPDPHQSPTKPLVPSASYFFELPKSHRFDAESLFHENGHLTLIEKDRNHREPNTYQLDLNEPSTIKRPIPLKRTVKLPRFREPATGASLSRDGRQLAVCSNAVLNIYLRDPQGAWQLQSEVKYPPMAAEGVTWDGDDLILAVEGDGLYRVRAKIWRAAATARLSPPSDSPSHH